MSEDEKPLVENNPASSAGATVTESSVTEEVAPKPRPSATARVALFVSVLALLLVLAGAGGGGWYLWQRHQDALAQVQTLQQIQTELAGKASRSEVSQAGQQPQREIARLQQTIGQLQSAQSGQGQRLEQLADLINRNQRGWTLAETLYLLRMADYRLRLAQDRNSAIAALEAADQALARLGEIDLLPVREALAEEIARLKRLPKPDPEGVALTLGELQNGIGRLGLKGRQAGAAESGPVESGDGGVFWSTLQKFVVIRKNNQEVAARPEPADFASARRRLHTALELARLSALRLDLQVFGDSLEQALGLLTAEFDTDSETGRAFAETLQQQAARLHVGVAADIGRARRLLEDFMAADRNPLQGNG